MNLRFLAAVVGALCVAGCGGRAAEPPAANTGGSTNGSGGDAPGAGANTTGVGGTSSEPDAAVGGGPDVGADDDGGCSASCQASNGVTIGCAKRFFFGMNWAWGSFGSDFGSSTNGVTARRAQRLTTLQDVRANGVDVVRWWVFPNFTGGGVSFDANNSPTGLAGTTAADIASALDLAAEVGVHLEFTLFSFDSFKINVNATTVNPHNLAPLISDPNKLAALMTNVVSQFASEVDKSANRDRVVSWDVINEPEWAISGSDGIDQAFTPQATVTTVDYPTMKAFIVAAVAALHGVSDRPVTVGGAAIKWAKAWAGIGDFYTFHMYDWVNQSFPYNRSLAEYGVTDKPVVLGEFPVQGLTGVPYATLVGTIFDMGYAGATAWAVNDRNFPWAPNKPNVKAFSDAKGCVVQY